jgi:hypothetical protein
MISQVTRGRYCHPSATICANQYKFVNLYLNNMRREILTLTLGTITLYLGTKAAQAPNAFTTPEGYIPPSTSDPEITGSGLGSGGPGSSGAKIARVRGSIADVLSGDAKRRGALWWDYGRDSSVVSLASHLTGSGSKGLIQLIIGIKVGWIMENNCACSYR